MEYLLTFLEGIISFISPCMLPMLPVYISYFAGGDTEKKSVLFLRVLAFVFGFTAIYAALGLSAGFIGSFLISFKTAVNIVFGLLMVFFGLCYLEVIKLGFLKGIKNAVKAESIISAFVFGIIFSVSQTSCTGVFLGSALTLAANSGTAPKGVMLLVSYSLGMGIPFLLSALLLNRLKKAFSFIKRHYRVINTVCGIFLIAVGVLMMAGLFDKLILLMR